MSQNAVTAHNSRANEADIYLAFVREELQRANFPFQLPTNRLKRGDASLIDILSY
jgi:hypothetical protein